MRDAARYWLNPARWEYYWRLMRFHRPIGILLLLWPTLWALWWASAGQPRMDVVVVFVCGVVLMRAAGCVINDYADRDFDPHVARTRERPLAAGEVTPREALWLFAVLCTLAFLLVLTMNALTIGLSFIGALLAASYPFTKRVTHWPQAYLGIAFAWAVPMAFAAQTGTVPTWSWWIFLATALWALIYDTEYAMVDRDDDVKIGVKSTAIWFGRWDRAAIAALQGAMWLILAWLGVFTGRGGWYFAGLLVVAGLFVYQQMLIAQRQREACFRAFTHNHWVGLTVFVGLLLDYSL